MSEIEVLKGILLCALFGLMLVVVPIGLTELYNKWKARKEGKGVNSGAKFG